MQKGLFIVISGPSGVGKGTICSKLLKKLDAWYSVSMTTREMRKGEQEGVDYYFVDKDTFEEIIRNNEFLEYAVYNDCYYGTPKDIVLEKLNRGIDVFTEIDIQGARQIKSLYANAILFYILPPSMEELEQRLYQRATESVEDIQKRLMIAYQ